MSVNYCFKNSINEFHFFLHLFDHFMFFVGSLWDESEEEETSPEVSDLPR